MNSASSASSTSSGPRYIVSGQPARCTLGSLCAMARIASAISLSTASPTSSLRDCTMSSVETPQSSRPMTIEAPASNAACRALWLPKMPTAAAARPASAALSSAITV